MSDFLMIVPDDYSEITVGEPERMNMVEIQLNISNQDWLSMTQLLQSLGTILETQTVLGARVFGIGDDYRMWLSLTPA